MYAKCLLSNKHSVLLKRCFVTCPIWVRLRQDACFSVIFVCSAPSPSPQVVYKMPQLGSSRIKINEDT